MFFSKHVLKNYLNVLIELWPNPVFPNTVLGCTPTLQIFPNQTHLNQLISSLVETPGPEIYWSDKGDIQNVHCWCASRNRVGKHWPNPGLV